MRRRRFGVLATLVLAVENIRSTPYYAAIYLISRQRRTQLNRSSGFVVGRLGIDMQWICVPAGVDIGQIQYFTFQHPIFSSAQENLCISKSTVHLNLGSCRRLLTKTCVTVCDKGHAHTHCTLPRPHRKDLCIVCSEKIPIVVDTMPRQTPSVKSCCHFAAFQSTNQPSKTFH